LNLVLILSTFVLTMRTKLQPLDPAGRVLFGGLRGQLLALVLNDPSRPFYLREIVRLTGASPGTLQREVGILTKAGLFLREKRGRQVYYRANSCAPVYPELRGLIRKTMSGAAVLRSALVPLADRIRAAVVFGSMARGELNATSDIDLLVVGDVELSEVLEALKPAEAELGREINAVVYLPAEYRRRQKERRHFAQAVSRGPRLAIIGDLDAA
jgi:predicted nucleotidyltransferase